MLRTRTITLLDPGTWDDKNDAFFMAQYKRQKDLKALLALCFADCPETYHHWRVFSHGADGVRVEFDKALLLKAFKGDDHVIHGDMRYKLIKELQRPGSFSVGDLPFLKRRPFKDEREFRIIYAHPRRVSFTKDYKFDLAAVRAITLSPWIVGELADSVIDNLRQIDGCSLLRISRSTLVDNAEWKKLALKLDPTI
jgi:hypothetical protein